MRCIVQTAAAVSLLSCGALARARWRKALLKRGLHSITARRICRAYFKYVNRYLAFKRNMLPSDLPFPNVISFAEHYVLIHYLGVDTEPLPQLAD